MDFFRNFAASVLQESIKLVIIHLLIDSIFQYLPQSLMRLFWKIVLTAAIPLGGYYLYKEYSRPTETKVEPEESEKNKTASQSHYEKDAKERGDVGSYKTERIIEQLSKIDGVTSRVAENLVKRGIKSKEALMKLTKEELRSVKGIGPKRSAKIFKLR